MSNDVEPGAAGDADSLPPAGDDRALAPRADVRPTTPVPFELRDTSDEMRLATHLATSDLVPNALRGKPANVFLVMATGRELGLTPMQAISTLGVINGKVTLPGQLIVARVIQSGEAEYFRCVESTEERATYVTRRRGWGSQCPSCRTQFPASLVNNPCPRGCRLRDESGDTPDPAIVELASQSLTWTKQMSKDYGLMKPSRNGTPSNHVTKPAVMFRWRAASQLARDVYPDIALGLYTPDESREFDDGEVVVETTPTGLQGLKSIIADAAKDDAD